MKNELKTFSLVAAAFVVGAGINNIAFSDIATQRIAVVDVAKVVAQSSQVQALKKEQETKMSDLQKWLTTARADVAKQSTNEGKQKLTKKYDEEFAKKKESIQKNYSTKLQAIDKSISATIAEQAKAQNYDLVISKGVVLYGGTDITSSIAKVVK